jgi:hypothetical protein
MMSTSASAAASAAGSVAAATMSRSFTESAFRRAEPAISTRTAAGCARRASATASPTSSARERTTRSADFSAAPAASAARTLSSNFGPKPFASRSVPDSAAARSVSIESMPSWSYIARTRLGPTPGRRVIAARPGGMRSRSLPSAGIVPVSTIARIFSSSVLPTPGSEVTRPSCASLATETVALRTFFAAVRYASTRWTTAPSSS